MNTRPTPETDKFFATFADGEAAPSHAEYYARLQDLERERDEWKALATQYSTTMKTPKEKASEDIIDAWLIEGVHPPTHRKLKEQLRQEWPVLAKAIERLVNAEDSPELADAIRERDAARKQVENQKARIGEFFDALEKLTSERDEARGQRDRLAGALKNCRDDLEMILLERLPNPSETWCTLLDADAALQSLTTNQS